MKRTSKKLLSLFLAVVMVITSCSVGLVAFAADDKKIAAQNSQLYADDAEAYKSIEKILDFVVPSLLGIAIDEDTTLGSVIGMTSEEIKTATVKDVVGAASPLLLGKLTTSDNPKDFLTKHSSITGITEDTWRDKYYNYYSYLDDANSEGLSFYDLYKLCENNKNNKENPEFAKYCASTLEQLNILLSICSAAEKAYSTQVNAANSEYESLVNYTIPDGEYSGYYVGDLFYAIKNYESKKSPLTPSELGEIEYNGTKIKDLPLEDADGNKTAFGYGVDICNAALKELGVDIQVENAAGAVLYYYTLTTGYFFTESTSTSPDGRSLSFVQALQYIDLASKGGAPLKYNGTVLTLDNFAKVLSAKNANDEIMPGIVAQEVYNCLFDLYSKDEAENTLGMTCDTFASSSFEAINKANLVAAGYGDMNAVEELIKDAKITDEQLAELHTVAVENNWSGSKAIIDYINSADCTLSHYVVETLNIINMTASNDLSQFVYAIRTSVDAAKAFTITGSSDLINMGIVRNKGKEMPFVDLLNNIMSGIITSIEISSGYTIPSATIVSAPRFDIIEINKYESAIAPAIEKYSYSYSDYAVPDEYIVLVVSNLLDYKIDSILKTEVLGNPLSNMVDGLLETNVTLLNIDNDGVATGVLADIWQKLYEAPVDTIITLVPVLTALVDEVVLPKLLNQEGDAEHGSLDGFLDDATTTFGRLALKNGNTKVGITTLSFDLNTIVPALLAFFAKDGGFDAAHKLVPTYEEYISEKGIVVEDDETDFAAIPMFTGVLAADRAIAGLNIGELLSGIDALSGGLDQLLSGIIYDVVDMAKVAVDDYLKEHKDDARYVKVRENINAAVLQRGLNNLSVALPYLVDNIYKSFTKKYSIASDWTAVPAGKIAEGTKTFDDGDVKYLYNQDIQNIKDCATLPANVAPAKIYGYLSALVGNWVDGVMSIVNGIGASISGTKEVFWNLNSYADKITGSFNYPTGITAQDAEEAVVRLDSLVQNLFPLLKSLGVLNVDSLDQLVSDNLYTNALLTTMAKGIYGSLENLFKSVEGVDIAAILAKSDLDLSTKGIAAYLTDSRFGTTYSSAAKTLNSVKSWNDVKTLNWGFKDGSEKAQAGFINGVAAILRPLNGILSMFLVGGDTYDKAPILEMINSLNFTLPVFYDEETQRMISISMSKGVFDLVLTQNNENTNISIDLGAIFDGSHLFEMGTNGYESAIIPVLEAFMCKNIKTYDQYVADYKKASDNLLVDILTPLFGLVNDVIAAPATTLTSVLPNVAYFIDNNGLAQVVGNLLAPLTSKDGIIGKLDGVGINVDQIITLIAGKPLGDIITDALGLNVSLTMNLADLSTCNIQDIILPIVKNLLGGMGIKLPDFTFAEIASHGTIETVASKAKNSNGKYLTKRVVANKGEVLVAVLRYVADALIKNASFINNALRGIDAIKKNSTIKDILNSVFASIRSASKDDIVRAIFYLISDINASNVAEDAFFDYSNFKTKSNNFTFGNMDEEFCRKLAPMLDGLIGGLLGGNGGLNGLIGGMLYKDDIISSLATGLYGAIEGVKIDGIGSLSSLLAKTGIDFSTENVARLLTDKTYGKEFSAAAGKIKSAGSWKNVNKASLSWGVTDRDSFVHALVAVLRPLYGVLDVILNNSQLHLFNLVSVKGSDGYTSFIVPLLEAFGCYNIRTQYDYRMDMEKEYDAILIDILNPILDKVEDVLNAPIEMLADILPNLSLFFANDGLLQVIDNLLTPVSALLDALKPIVNVNSILKIAGLNINSLLSKIGVKTNVDVDIYNLKATLTPLIASENVVSLLNGILGTIKIGGKSLGIVLPEIDWFQLASHGTVIKTTSQAAIKGERIMVQADQDETLIAVLRFLINTINYQNNYNAIVGLVGGLLGDAGDSVSGIIDEVLGMLQGDADTVIESLVDLLQSIAG